MAGWNVDVLLDLVSLYRLGGGKVVTEKQARLKKYCMYKYLPVAEPAITLNLS